MRAIILTDADAGIFAQSDVVVHAAALDARVNFQKIRYQRDE
jgi:hypothetical protein